MIGSPQQLKQDNGCSAEKLKLELENKSSANCVELREETRHDPVRGNSDLPVNVEPKKGESSAGITCSCYFFHGLNIRGNFIYTLVKP